MTVRTHTFKLGKYHIEELDRGMDGMCDLPLAHGVKPRLTMRILSGGSFRALWTALHESGHAEGLPDRYLGETNHKGE